MEPVGCVRMLATMHRGFLGRLACAAAVLASALGSAQAAGDDAYAILRKASGDAALRATLIREGRAASFFCANCHGEEGTSRYAEVPNLAGQHPVYLVDQIEAFLSGRRRNEFMQGLMKVLGEREKAAIALAYAEQPGAPALKAAPPSAKAGAAHFQRVCARCHDGEARGGESIPRLAGQQPEYLRLSLLRYLRKTGERVSPDMSAAVAELGEANIDAVVAYLASLR